MHEQTCETKTIGGCRLCARFTNLITFHARKCKVDACKVPHCFEMKHWGGEGGSDSPLMMQQVGTSTVVIVSLSSRRHGSRPSLRTRYLRLLPRSPRTVKETRAAT